MAGGGRRAAGSGQREWELGGEGNALLSSVGVLLWRNERGLRLLLYC
jgi:hypothetical protein